MSATDPDLVAYESAWQILNDPEEFKRALRMDIDEMCAKYKLKPIPFESSSINIGKEDMPADTCGKERVDSDISGCSVDKTERNNIHSESVSSQGTSLVVAKHGKHKKLARLDFSGAKGVVHLSGDYRIIDQSDKDQAPTSKKEETTGCTDKTGQADFGTGQAISSLAGTAKPAWPVSLADHTAKPARPVPLVPAAADASLDDSAPVLDYFLEMKGNIMQIKDMYFSSMINKVQSTSILPNFQSGCIISIATSISDILASNVKRPTEESNLLVDNEINSDCISQHIIPYQEADENILSKLKLSPMFTLDSISMWVSLLALN
jgi:hypothetical protein